MQTHESHRSAPIGERSIKKISEIYKNYSDNAIFPHYFAGITSEDIEELGFTRVEGKIKLDLPIAKKGRMLNHSWNVAKDGTIIDLTKAQFQEGLIDPVSRGPHFILPESPEHDRYKTWDPQTRSYT